MTDLFDPRANQADPAFTRLYGPLGPASAPFVIGQMGQSLDGFIATETGASHYITGPESLVHLHRLRALSDAVVLGWRTVESDDPRVTTRLVDGENPVRVVIDPDRRLRNSLKLFSGAPNESLRITAEECAQTGDLGLPRSPSGRLEPAEIVGALRSRGLARILVEGGGRLVSGFLDAGCLDRLHVVVAPLLIGAGLPGVRPLPASTLAGALRPPTQIVPCGADVLYDLNLSGSRDGRGA